MQRANLNEDGNVVVEKQGFGYFNITGTNTYVLKTGSGKLHSITFNKPVATGVVLIYNNSAGEGTLIGTITVPANPQPSTLLYDIDFESGLTIVVTTAAQDITVSYN